MVPHLIDIVPFSSFFHCQSRSHPYGPVQVEIGHIKRQEIILDIIRQIAVRLFNPAKVVEVSPLSERTRLI